MNRRIAVVIAVGCALVAVAVVAASQYQYASDSAAVKVRDGADEVPGELANSADSQLGPTQPVQVVAPLLDGPVALHVRYAFSLHSDVAFGRIDVGAGGTLQVGGVTHHDGQTWVPLRLTEATAALSGAGKRKLDPMPTSALERPFAVRVMANGRVDEVRFSSGVSYTARSVLAELAYALQLTDVPTAAHATWAATEADAIGPYEARYQRDGALVQRRVRTAADRIGERSTTDTTFELRGNHVQLADLKRRGKATTGGIKVDQFVPMELTISAARVELQDVAWAADVLIAQLQPFSVHGADRQRQPEAPARDAISVLSEARSSARTLDVGRRTRLRNELTWAIRQQPAALDKVLGTLRDGSLDSKAETVVIAALVGARTDAAQGATAELLKDDQVGRELRVRVLQSAALMSSPHPAFVSALMELALSHKDRAYAAAAATTVGASARYLAEKHPAQAAKVVDALVRHASPIVRSGLRLRVDDAAVRPGGKGREKRRIKPEIGGKSEDSAGDLAGDSAGTPPLVAPVGVRLAWLAALGNTGDAKAFGDIIAAVGDPNEAVRGGAVLALRFQSPVKCIETMVKLMATDRSIHVRENVVDAARHMGPAVTGQLVERALRFDESPFVRLAAAYTLSVWSADAPWLRKILVDALKREKNTRVIEAIQNFVDQGRVAGKPVTGVTKMGAP